MTTRGDRVHDLIEAVRAVRAAAADLSYPLPLPSAEPARADQAALLAQLDDYLLPRLVSLDAPLLVVVGGSTGAGKSTLVNSLVRAPVSPAGVRRPTTREPVLACHPAEQAWFRPGGPLASLVARTHIAMIAAPALSTGLAFLDIPDFDALTHPNRAVASTLLAAADLWLFVTTAARYADAVPWEQLRAARERGVVVALVLDRVPPHPAGSDSTIGVVAHLTELLASHGMASVPVFVLAETRVDGQGLLPDATVTPLRSWFSGLSADAPARTAVARCTLDGALAVLPARTEALAAAAAEQVEAGEALAEQVGLAYGGARAALEHSLAAAAAAAAPATGHRRGRRRRAEVDGNLATLVYGAAADAAEQAHAAWRTHPGGQALLAPGPAGPSPGLASKVERLVRAWHGDVREELLDRLGELLDAEAARWLDGLAAVPPDAGTAHRMRRAAADLAKARVAAALPAGDSGTASSVAAGASARSFDRAGQ